MTSSYLLALGASLAFFALTCSQAGANTDAHDAPDALRIIAVVCGSVAAICTFAGFVAFTLGH